MEFSKIFQEMDFTRFYVCVLIVIVMLPVINFILNLCAIKIKLFSKKSLQENVFIITFASEKERDRILTLIERDKQETEELEKQAKDFGLK